jgi:beta-glucosidase
MAEETFPPGFLWGAATAAYQVEGGARDGGRGESIWDRFCRVPGAIRGGDTGDVACDHYHRWREDVRTMRELGLRAYRFSIAWPRVFPAGRGAVNRAGLDFYESLVDTLLEAGIRPAATLYHWDLPQPLQDKGGWTNRDTASWFADYAAAVCAKLGDRVGAWMTINEPQVAAFCGYGEGVHAPGIRDLAAAVQAAHVLLLAHARAAQACRQGRTARLRIGIALNLHPVYPAGDSDADEEAAGMADARANRWYLDPLLRGVYPQELLAAYTRAGAAPRIEPDDMPLLAVHRPDFIGVNYYFPLRVRADSSAEVIGFSNVEPRGVETTGMGWEVYPRGLSDILARLRKDYDDPAMMITENGAAFGDAAIESGQIQDDDRIGYLAGHLEELGRAIAAGAKVEAYFLWSLMDNFEWAQGYSKRFGIIHVNNATQERTWKKSAGWYRGVIASNGTSL